jgi:hypothetical protein
MATPRRLLDQQLRSSDGSRPTAPLRAVRPLTRRGGGRAGVRVLVIRYMAAAVVLLAVVLALDPHDPDAAGRDGRPWQYQREAVEVQGRGVLNGYARGVIGATAWLTRGSVERVRDVNRLNLLDLLIGTPAAGQVSGWREENSLALERSTQLAMLLLVAFGVIARPPGRSWILVLLLLLSLTWFLAKPQTTVRLASGPSTGVPAVMLAVFSELDPGVPPTRQRTPRQAEEELVGSYWDSFVGNPLSRMQTGSPVLVGAEPERKAGVLATLRHGVGTVNDWAVGRRGWERAFIATTAFAYVVPFSVAVTTAAMVATAAQALLFVLCIAGLAVVPIAIDRRRRPAAVRYWLLPLLMTVGVLAASSLLSLALLRAGQALHRADEYAGVLLAGSTWPLVVTFVLRRRALRRRRRRTADPADVPGGTSQ